MDKILLDGDWKFQYGDEPSWSQVDINDQNWPTVKVPSLIKQLHKKPISGWYRFHFDADLAQHKQHAILIESLRHSDQTWLNGVHIGGEGQFEKPWRFTQTNPIELIRIYKIPAETLKAKNNVLAIKIGIGFGNAFGAMFPGGAGILRGHVYLGDYQLLNEEKQLAIIDTTAVDTFFITLGIVDLFIILFLLRSSLGVFPEFKWLFFTSFIMLLASIGHDFFYVNGFLASQLNLVLVIALLTMPISVASYFLAQYQNVRTRYIKILTVIWMISSALILLPWVSSDIKVISWYLWVLLAAGFFLYSAYCATKGVIMGRTGAVAQWVAICIFIISIRTQWLPDNFYGHRNVQIGSLFYRYALLFAYFQQIKHLRLDYKNLSQRVVKVADDIYANIARELHDGVGQHLASIKLQTKLAKLQSNSPHLLSIDQELSTSIAGLRRLLAGLHPVLVDQYHLAEAIENESRHFEKIYGINIQLDIPHINLQKDKEHQLFRIFQESTNNAIQHGHASKIHVQLTLNEQQIFLTIKDNGKGFNLNKKMQESNRTGLGLISLHERIALLNGHLSIKSHKNKGTKIMITLPLSHL